MLKINKLIKKKQTVQPQAREAKGNHPEKISYIFPKKFFSYISG